MFDTPPPHAPLFAWYPGFCCSTCAALTRAWRAPAGASPVLSPLDRTPTCCPCLLPAVTHGGALGLPEVGTGRAGTTAGAGSGASPCAKSRGQGVPPKPCPGVGGCREYEQYLLCKCPAKLMAADHEPPLENQQMGEDLCIRGESGTDLAQVGRLPQIMVPFINRGACGLLM